MLKPKCMQALRSIYRRFGSSHAIVAALSGTTSLYYVLLVVTNSGLVGLAISGVDSV